MAQPSEDRSGVYQAEEITDFRESFVLDSGRVPLPEPDPEQMSFALRGEYELRFRAHTDLPLEPPIGTAERTDLGQNLYLVHWMRWRPTFQYRDVLKIVGEIDLPRGLAVGDTTQDVGAARDDYADLAWYEVSPRKLYLDYRSPIGLLRVGHMTSHWAMGLVANDGDQPSLFGDYRRGSIVERLLLATRPGGESSPLAIALAGDLVFQDSRANLLDGDRALQVVGAIRYQTPALEWGLYGVYRHQESDRSLGAFNAFTEDLDVGVIDLAVRFNAPIEGTNAYAFGEAEVAYIGGSTTYVRNVDLTASGDEEQIQTFGGAAKIGAVHVAESDGRRWGDVVAAFEWGYASGDADPGDGVTRRFTFDQNHNVGLVLFDHVLAWKTARAATIAQDPNILNRPAPGLQFLPSEGGIFGAQYLNPTVVVRPRHWLDLKAGMVLAQTTADLVDPFHYGALGDYQNYEGGDENAHDLGLELDLGADARVYVADEIIVHGGVEGGVLFPGHAFDDGAGNRYPNQYLLNTKLGLQY